LYGLTYALLLVEFLWEGYSSLNIPVIPRTVGWKRLLPNKRRNIDNNSLEADKNSILELWWWLRIVLARAEGKLEPWEALRIVRMKTKQPSIRIKPSRWDREEEDEETSSIQAERALEDLRRSFIHNIEKF
jgi:hypothetical protein